MASAGPIIFAFDGSDGARRAIHRAAELLAAGPAIVLTVWESAASVVFRHDLPEGFEVALDVVDELDAATRAGAERTAAEGSRIAASHGFEAEAVAQRAFEGSPRQATAIWQEVVRFASERSASVVALGTRGRSGVRSAVLGSVSHGVVNNCEAPVLVVPDDPQTGPDP